MATSTKKSSKASAKTTTKVKTTNSKAKVEAKKPIEKTEKTEKVTEKTSVKSSVGNKSSVSKVSAGSSMDRLKALLRFSSLMHLALIGISIFALKQASTEWLWNAQARDLFAAGNKVDLGPSSEVIATVQNRYVLAAVLVVSLFMTVLLLTKYWSRYAASVKAHVSGLRWLFLGVSGALMLEFASMLAGVQDVFTLKVIGVLVLAGAMFGWFAERENKLSGGSHKLGVYLSGFVYALATLPMLASLIGTTVFNQQRFAWFVYVVVAASIFGLALTHRILRSSLSKNSKLDYSVYEYRYFFYDLVVKVVIVLSLVFGYMKV